MTTFIVTLVLENVHIAMVTVTMVTFIVTGIDASQNAFGRGV